MPLLESVVVTVEEGLTDVRGDLDVDPDLVSLPEGLKVALPVTDMDVVAVHEGVTVTEAVCFTVNEADALKDGVNEADADIEASGDSDSVGVALKDPDTVDEVVSEEDTDDETDALCLVPTGIEEADADDDGDLMLEMEAKDAVVEILGDALSESRPLGVKETILVRVAERQFDGDGVCEREFTAVTEGLKEALLLVLDEVDSFADALTLTDLLAAPDMVFEGVAESVEDPVLEPERLLTTVIESAALADTDGVSLRVLTGLAELVVLSESWALKEREFVTVTDGDPLAEFVTDGDGDGDALVIALPDVEPVGEVEGVSELVDDEH